MCRELCVLAVLLVNVACHHIALTHLNKNKDVKRWIGFRGKDVGVLRGDASLDSYEAPVQRSALNDNSYKWRSLQFLPDLNKRCNKSDVSKRKNLTSPNSQSVIDKIIRDYLSKLETAPDKSIQNDALGNIKLTSALRSKTISEDEKMSVNSKRKDNWNLREDMWKNITNDYITRDNKAVKMNSESQDINAQIGKPQTPFVGVFEQAPLKTVYSAKNHPTEHMTLNLATKSPYMRNPADFKTANYDFKKSKDEYPYGSKSKTFQNTSLNPDVELQTEKFFKSSLKWSPIIEKSLENFDNITKESEKLIPETELFKKAADLFNAISLENPFTISNIPLFLNYLNKENMAVANSTPKTTDDSHNANIIRNNCSSFEDRVDSQLKKRVPFFITQPRFSISNFPYDDNRAKNIYWTRRRGNEYSSRNTSRGIPYENINPLSLMLSQNPYNVPLLLIPLNKANLENLLYRQEMNPSYNMSSGDVPNPYLETCRKLPKPEILYKSSTIADPYKEERFKTKPNSSSGGIFNAPSMANTTVFKASSNAKYLDDVNYKKRVQTILKFTKPSLNSMVKPLSSCKTKQLLCSNEAIIPTYRTSESLSGSTMSSIFKKHQNFLTNMLPLLNTTSDMAISKFSNEKKIINFEKGSGNNANIKGNLFKIQQEMTTEPPDSASVAYIAQTTTDSSKGNILHNVTANNTNIIQLETRGGEIDGGSTSSPEYIQLYFTSSSRCMPKTTTMMTEMEQKLTEEISIQIIASTMKYENTKSLLNQSEFVDKITSEPRSALQHDRIQEQFSDIISTTSPQQIILQEETIFKEFSTEPSNYSYLDNVSESTSYFELPTEYSLAVSSSDNDANKYQDDMIEETSENQLQVKTATDQSLPNIQVMTVPGVPSNLDRIHLYNSNAKLSNSMTNSIQEKDDILTRRGPNFLTNLVNRLIQTDHGNGKANVFEGRNYLNKDIYPTGEQTSYFRNKLFVHPSKSYVNFSNSALHHRSMIQDNEEENNKLSAHSLALGAYNTSKTNNENIFDNNDKLEPPMYPTVVFNLPRTNDSDNNLNISNPAFQMVYLDADRNLSNQDEDSFNYSTDSNIINIKKKMFMTANFNSQSNRFSDKITNCPCVTSSIDTSEVVIGTTSKTLLNNTNVEVSDAASSSLNRTVNITNDDNQMSTEQTFSQVTRLQHQNFPAKCPVGMKTPVIYVTFNTAPNVLPSMANVTSHQVPLKIFIIRAPLDVNPPNMMKHPDTEKTYQVGCDVQKAPVTPNPQKKCMSEVTLFPIYPMYPVYPIKPLLSSSTSQSNSPPGKSKCLISIQD